MRVRSLLVAMVAVAAALGTTVIPATAQTACVSGSGSQYPPTAPSLQLSASSVLPGAQIQITGNCGAANGVVNLEFRSVPVALGSAMTNAQGTFSRSVTIPADATPGQHTIVATGAGFDISAAVNVLSSPASGSTNLPRTGAGHTVQLVIAGLALVLIGVFAVRTTRRKRTAAAA